jgi:hypothetical protein
MASSTHEVFTGQTAAAVVKGNSARIDSAGKIAVGGANEKIDGVVSRSAGSGDASGIVWGKLTVVASEAVSAGAEIAPAASGKFESADSTDWVAGKAITSAAGDASEFEAFIYPPGGGYVKA